MQVGWRAFTIGAGLLVLLLVVQAAWLDRKQVLDRAQADTRSSVAILAAHADAALGEANQIAQTLIPEIESWDLADPVRGGALHLLLRRLVEISPRIVSAWVLDGEGTSRLDSWSDPARPVDAAERRHFRRHLGGEIGPVVDGTERGSLSGLPRFTFSVAVRDASGGLHAVIVVAVLAEGLAEVYTEVSDFSHVRAGLFTTGGEVLAMSAGAPDLRDLVAALAVPEDPVAGAALGTRLLESNALVAWRISGEFPDLLALSMVDISAEMAAWWSRTLLMAAMAGVLVLLVALVARGRQRMQAEQDHAARLQLASREVHHRMKNSLQMMASFLQLRARRATDPAVIEELRLVTGQLRALSEVQNLLEVSGETGQVDLSLVLARLCEQVGTMHDVAVRTDIPGGLKVDSTLAGRVAIIVNELLTNALKHGDGQVQVEMRRDRCGTQVIVSNGGPLLPADFDLGRQKGFGLKSSALLCESIGARLGARPGGALGGAEFTLTLDAPQAAPAPAAAA